MPFKDSINLLVERVHDLHGSANEQLRKVDPVILLIGAIGGTVVYLNVSKWYRRSEEPLAKRIAGYVVSKIRKIPSVKAKIDKQISSARKDMVDSIHKDDTDRQFLTAIPAKGMENNEILALASRYDGYGTFAVKEGKVSGAVYTEISEPHLDLLEKIYRIYAYSNPLHADVFPGVRKMEAEVIRMVLNLYNAPEDARGSITTGGTESIIMACFAYRNRALERGIENPVILCSITAHAAFDKAAHLCGMRVRHVPVDENNRVNLKLMEKAIDGDVCMLVGSAPNYPSGTVDPIPEISKLGQKYSIPVHVDACLGGFMIPFMNDAGYFLQPFDFRNAGVTSISCDTHKYGCTPKGSSVVMYRNEELHHYQYFSIPQWTGGLYATPTICGSRAGANTASAWATLLMFGRDEYVSRCRSIVVNVRAIADGIRKMDLIELHGSPDVSVVAFRSKQINIYAVADRMHKRGWNLNSLQNPEAVHICLTKNHADPKVVDSFLADLQTSVDEVNALPDKGKESKTAALYGMAAQIPDNSLLDEMTATYLDACYTAPPPLK